MNFIVRAENFAYDNFTEIYDYYFKSFVAVKNIGLLLPSKTSILAFSTVFFIVVIIAKILRLTSDSRNYFISSVNENDTSRTWIFFNEQIIEDNKKALEELHQATDKCYSKHYILKCIELAIHYPHLLNVCLPNSKGITPFHRVCYRGNYCLIDFMITKGANVNQTTDSGETAFHMVIDYYIRNSTQRKFNCLDLLYEKGCFLKENSAWYKKLVSDVRKAKNEDLVQWLASHSTPGIESQNDENYK